MKKIAGIGLMMFFSVLIGIAPVDGGNGMDVPTHQILKKQDDGREIRVRSGDLFRVELEGRGGTGFWWHVEKLNAEVLELLSEETKDVSPGRVGGPVQGRWTFRAKGVGGTDLHMDYYRQWEGIERAVDHFRVRIIIE